MAAVLLTLSKERERWDPLAPRGLWFVHGAPFYLAIRANPVDRAADLAIDLLALVAALALGAGNRGASSGGWPLPWGWS